MLKRLLLASSFAFLVNATVVAAEENPKNFATFQDVSGNFAEKEITKLYQDEIVRNDGTDMFRPNDPITRAELLTLILGAKGIAPLSSNSSHFSDVSENDWFYPYAETAYRLGFFDGKRVGGQLVVQPDSQVTKQELVETVLLANGEGGRVNQFLWSKTIQTLSTFKDGTFIDEDKQQAMAYAITKKLISADQNKSLLPQKIMTRAEAAKLVCAYIHMPNEQFSAWKTVQGVVPVKYKKEMLVKTTAYNEAGMPSFIGLPLRNGIVAVDPKVIPLGTHLYITGYGYAVAADIGSAVKEKHIDVFLPSHSAAVAYGSQKDTKVYILD